MVRRPSTLLALPFLLACQPSAPAENDVAEEQRSAAAAEEGAAKSQFEQAGAAADGRHSGFSTLDPQSCRLLEENLEEGGYWRRLCSGHGGYEVEHSESDLRQDLVLIGPDGERSRLRLSSIVANGAFNELGETIEWRGDRAGDPDTLIVRLDVASGADPDAPDVSNLVVARLAKPICIVAVVPPGTGQNERAREIADGELPGCIGEPGRSPDG